MADKIPLKAKFDLDGNAVALAEFEPGDTITATIISEDATHRFATDAEKTSWNSKEAGGAAAAAQAAAALDATAKANAAQAAASADATAKVAAHEALTDPHPQYATDAALSSGLSGKADLVGGVVPSSQLPSYVDDVLEVADFASLPVTGETGKIYVTLSDNNSWRWTGSTYQKVSQPLDEMPQAVAEAGTSETLYAATSRRIRQAIAAWWAGITNIDGKNIGATTAGTGRFTTLEATGNLSSQSWAVIGLPASDSSLWYKIGTIGSAYSAAGAIRIVANRSEINHAELSIFFGRGAASNIRCIGYGNMQSVLAVRLVSDTIYVQFNTFHRAAVYVQRRTASTFVVDYAAGVSDPGGSNATIETLVANGDSPTFANLIATGNTTLGDSMSDTVTINAQLGVGGAPNANNMIRVSGSGGFTGGTNIGVSSLPTGSVSATGFLEAYASAPVSAASAYTVTTVSGYHAYNATKGAGSTITNQNGVLIDDQTQGTNNYGITSQVSAGTNKRNINAIGTADNVLMGNVGIGSTNPTEALTVNKTGSGGQNTKILLQSNSVSVGAVAINPNGAQGLVIESIGNYPLICRTNGVDRLNITSTGVVRPAADNTQSLGEASFRWGTVFAGTGTINTSDATLKTSLRDFTDAELDAIGDCRLGIFQWLDSVAEKRDAARLHPGVIAQQLMSAFEARNLDPLRYAPICRDRMTVRVQTDSVSVWKKRPVMIKEVARDERVEIIDGVPTVVVTEREVEAPKTELRQLIGADGKPVMEEVQAKDEAGELLFEAQEGGEPIPVMVKQSVMYPCPVEEDYLDFEPVFEERDAGWRYGIRYSQLLVMIASYERRERERLAARVASLEVEDGP